MDPGFTTSGVLFGLARHSAPPSPYRFRVPDDFERTFRQAPLLGVSCGTFGEQGNWLQRSQGGETGEPFGVAPSQDGFRTWVETPMQADGPGVDAPQIDVFALDAAGRGWAGTDTNLLHTRGCHWTVVSSPAGPAGPVGFSIDGLGRAMLANGLVQRFSTDAGATWRRLEGTAADGEQGNIQRDGGRGLLSSVGGEQTGFAWQRSMDDGRTGRAML